MTRREIQALSRVSIAAMKASGKAKQTDSRAAHEKATKLHQKALRLAGRALDFHNKYYWTHGIMSGRAPNP